MSNGFGMKRTASAKTSSKARGTSTRAANPLQHIGSLSEAGRDGNLRVVDESGEDHVFAAARFVAIEVPAAVRASLLKASQG